MPDPQTAPAPAPLVFADSETTHLHRDLREPWDVALIRREPDGTETTWQFFIEVEHLDMADPFSLKIGGFYERHPLGRTLARTVPVSNLDQYHGQDETRALLYGGARPAMGVFLTRRAAAEAIARITYGAHLVCAVPGMEDTVFDKLVRSQGMVPQWHYHLQDVENIAAGWLQAKRPGHALARPPYGSDALAAAVADVIGEETGTRPDLTIPDEERHTALGDARWVRTWWDAMYAPAVTRG